MLEEEHRSGRAHRRKPRPRNWKKKLHNESTVPRVRKNERFRAATVRIGAFRTGIFGFFALLAHSRGRSNPEAWSLVVSHERLVYVPIRSAMFMMFTMFRPFDRAIA